MRPYEEDEQSFLQKHRLMVGFGLLAAIAIAVWLGQKVFDQNTRPRHDQDFVMVDLPPPPPAPPPPSQAPPTPTESDDKMVEQSPVDETETKPDVAPKDQAPANEAALGTSIQGNGSSDGFGLAAGNGSGSIGGTGRSASHGSGSRWGWYAGQVQNEISQALQNNHSTRTADFRVVVRIWSDRTGRITRARLAGSTGNAALDSAITNDILRGLILQEPPPDGMPMPIVLRLTAQQSQAALSR
jgi:outer membrane biosynthesis protein TonB